MELKNYNVDPPAVNLLASNCTGSETTIKRKSAKDYILFIFALEQFCVQ